MSTTPINGIWTIQLRFTYTILEAWIHDIEFFLIWVSRVSPTINGSLVSIMASIFSITYHEEELRMIMVVLSVFFFTNYAHPFSR